MSAKSKKRLGNCYVCVESLFHLLGGKKAGLTPHTLRHEGSVHWYLVKRIVPLGAKGGLQAPVLMPIAWIIDPTVSQFKKKPDYTKGHGCGFLTRRPSKRARELMSKMVWQETI